MSSKALRAERGKIILDARAIMNSAIVNPEDDARFDAMMASAALLMDRIERIERADAAVADLGTVIARQADLTGATPRDTGDAIAIGKALERRLFRAHILQSHVGLSDADRQVMQQRIENVASVGTASLGGFLVAPDFIRELIQAQKLAGGMREAARSFTTDTGVDITIPTTDDTANVATIVAENTTGVAGTDMVFGIRTMRAWMYRSGFLPLSLELMQDSAFDFDELIMGALANRFHRAQNAHFTTGDGTTQPQGVTIGAAVGKVGIVGQTLTVISDDLVDLEHSIDPVYRKKAVFMMHDTVFRNIKKLKDTTGQPLFLPGFASGSYDTILGYPVKINQDMAVMAANARSILFGDFSNYWIRDVMNLRILRLNELYAANAQIAFIGFQRTDGRLITAATPIRWYQNSAT